jgi:energy-coupling factor transport system permease protein
LFVNAFRRADDLAIAMEAKCYRGGRGRTHYRKLQIKKNDIIIFAFTIIVAIITSLIF